MRVRADDQITGRDMSGFHQYEVGDPGIDVVELSDTKLPYECPALQVVRGILLRFGRSNVIQYDSDPVWIVELRCADLFHHADRTPCRSVTHHEIRIGIHDSAWGHCGQSGLLVEALLGVRTAQRPHPSQTGGRGLGPPISMSTRRAVTDRPYSREWFEGHSAGHTPMRCRRPFEQPRQL